MLWISKATPIRQATPRLTAKRRVMVMVGAAIGPRFTTGVTYATTVTWRTVKLPATATLIASISDFTVIGTTDASV